jgi:monoamine oxidase
MFFAGEHTCFAYFGYMEGALQSGQIAASAVLKTASGQRQRQNA